MYLFRDSFAAADELRGLFGRSSMIINFRAVAIPAVPALAIGMALPWLAGNGATAGAGSCCCRSHSSWRPRCWLGVQMVARYLPASGGILEGLPVQMGVVIASTALLRGWLQAGSSAP